MAHHFISESEWLGSDRWGVRRVGGIVFLRGASGMGGGGVFCVGCPPLMLLMFALFCVRCPFLFLLLSFARAYYFMSRERANTSRK